MLPAAHAPLLFDITALFSEYNPKIEILKRGFSYEIATLRTENNPEMDINLSVTQREMLCWSQYSITQINLFFGCEKYRKVHEIEGGVFFGIGMILQISNFPLARSKMMSNATNIQSSVSIVQLPCLALPGTA
jgi:hypothetical protein